MPAEPALDTLIDALLAAELEFIVVGGLAALLHGAPIATRDLDIVHHRSEENVSRLLHVLSQLDARVNDLTGCVLRPSRAALLGPGTSKLLTRQGPLDILGLLPPHRGYSDLIDRTVSFQRGEHSLHVLDLPTLIRVKGETGRAKDRLLLPILLALLREQSRP